MKRAIVIAVVGCLAASRSFAASANECNRVHLLELKRGGLTVSEALEWCHGTGKGEVALKAEDARAAGSKDDSQPKVGAMSDAGMTSSSNRAAAAPEKAAPAGVSTSAPSAADKNVFAGSPPDSINGVVRPQVQIPGFRVAGDFDRETADGKPVAFDLPAGAHFIITNDVIETPKGRNKAVELLYGRVAFDKTDPKTHTDPLSGRRSYQTTLSGSRGAYTIRDDIEYVVERASFASHENVREGYTYGILTAPYKFFPTNHSFVSSATIGPYIGYELNWLGISGKVIGSFGLTSVPVISKDDAGKAITTNKAALSISTGILWDLNNKFQMGLLVGADTVGPGSGYQYNGKPWLAIDIGYKFSN